MGVVVSLFSFVNSALTNVQKKRAQFKKCRVHVATVVRPERGPPDGYGSCDDTYQCRRTHMHHRRRAAVQPLSRGSL